MKLAYTFHGHSRTWKDTYQKFFENVYSVAPGDIFIHTWGDQVSPPLGSAWNGWVDLNDEQMKVASSRPDINGIFQAYNPKIMIVEPEPGINLELLPEHLRNEVPSRPNLGTKNMLYSTRSIFEAAMKYDDYDFIFNTRLDVEYNSKLNINELNSGKVFRSNMHEELWMFGSTDFMDIKTNYYHYIDQYWFQHPDYVRISYEQAFYRYLYDNNVREIYASDLQYKILRPFPEYHDRNTGLRLSGNVSV